MLINAEEDDYDFFVRNSKPILFDEVNLKKEYQIYNIYYIIFFILLSILENDFDRIASKELF